MSGSRGSSHGLRRLVAVCMLAAMTAACGRHVVRDDAVTADMVLPPAADRAALRDDQTFLMPAPIEAPLPEFPTGIEPLAGETVVCVDVWVDAGGQVSDALPAALGDDCAAPDDEPVRPYLDSVRAAVGRWSFFAAAICSHEPGDDAACEGAGADFEAVAVRLPYRFVFSSSGQVEVRGRD